MKLRKNNRVRFCVQGYDKWGIAPQKKWFVFTLCNANIVEFQDSETYAFFNKAVEKNAIVEILIGKEKVDVKEGIEIVRKEVEKYKDIRHPGYYRVEITTTSWVGVKNEWVRDFRGILVQEWEADKVLWDTAEHSARRGDYQSWYYYYNDDEFRPGYYALYKQDVTTGEYTKCDDDMQKEFRDKLAEEWNRQKEEWIKNGKR